MTWRILLAVCLALLAMPAEALSQDSFLAPLGPVAEAQRAHLVRVTLITMVAIVPVLVGVPLILWRFRRRKDGGNYRPGRLYRPDWEFSGPLEAVMWGVPFAIIAVLGWWLWHETHRLDPYEARGPGPLEVQAIGLDWKWLFIYPEQGRATLNELAIPVGRPVRVALTTDTVMQSFRVSALAGQIYAMPGMRSELNFLAFHRGTALGRNMQYSGNGFAGESFVVTAMSEKDWRAWIGAPADLTLDRESYAILARAASAAETIEILGLGARDVVRFDLALPGLFDAVIARYHQGTPVTAEDQPGAPAFEGKFEGETDE